MADLNSTKCCKVVTKSRSLRLLQLAACSLVLAGFIIDFAGIRWGGYIPTPLPGLFLADALWGAGALLGVPVLVASVRLRNRHVHAAAIALAFGLAQGIRASQFDYGSDPYLALRDVAPFLYLSLVPLVAAVLGSVKLSVFLHTLRAGVIVLSLGYLTSLLRADLFAPGGYLHFDSLEGIVFPGRGDILGVSLGIGVIAWGNFGELARQSRMVQGALVAIGATNGSRAGLLALVVCIGWAIYRERRELGWLTALKVLAALALCLLAGQVAPSVLAPSPAPSVLAPSLATPSVAERALAEGLWNPTASARWDTYGDVVRAMAKDWSWVLGFGVGHPFSLLEACGVSPSEYESSGGTEKCSVDSGSNLQPLRDPHNWVLGMLLYHGAVGTLVFISIVGIYLWPLIREPITSLAVVPVLVYFMVGLFSVVVSSPFGMLPIATFLSVTVVGAASGLHARPPSSGLAHAL